MGLFAVAATPAAAQTTGPETETTTPDQHHRSADELEDETLRRRVQYLLGGYHFTPSREQLDELAEADRVAATLRTIASDDSVRPSVRGRAVDVLALYEDDKTVAFLEKLLAPPEDGLSDQQRRIATDLRHRAILSYAQNRPADQAVGRLAPLFELGDRQIQLTVVAALANYTGEAGRQKLVALAESVEDDIVRDELATHVDVGGASSTDD